MCVPQHWCWCVSGVLQSSTMAESPSQGALNANQPANSYSDLTSSELLSQNILRGLGDRSYDKRKAAALELTSVIRTFQVFKNFLFFFFSFPSQISLFFLFCLSLSSLHRRIMNVRRLPISSISCHKNLFVHVMHIKEKVVS